MRQIVPMTEAGFSSDTRFFTLSTAGHVDHGKTSLLRRLTGIDPDRLKEEKERQMTTDLGFAFLPMADDVVVGFVDVPGHGKFLKNMLAGVGGIDLALLVVAADEGPMPQTVQHVRILSLLGIDKAIVALTKIDMVDDAEHLQLVKNEIADLLERHRMSMLALVPVSSATGAGLDELKAVIANTLRAFPKRDTAGGAFLPVDRVFSKPGFGTVITGTLVRGKLSVGDQVVIGPDVSSGRVRRLETHGRSVQSAAPGQRLACNLVLKDNRQLTRGHLLLTEPVPASKMIIARLSDKPAIAGDKFAQLLRTQPVRVYHGTAEHHGHIRWAQASSSVETGEAIALIAFQQPVAMQAADRFVVRMSDETIFGGVVVLRDKPRWLSRAAGVELAELAVHSDEEAIALKLVSAAPHHMVKQDHLSLILAQPHDRQTSDRLLAAGKLVRLGDWMMLPGTRQALCESLLQTVKEQSSALTAASREPGVALELARGKMRPRLDRGTFQTLVEEETKEGRLVRTADKLTLPGSTATAQGNGRLEGQILQALQDNFCLDLKELATICRCDPNKLKSAVKSLSDRGALININYEFALTSEHWQRAHKALAEIWDKKRNISPGEFRESLGTSRKYAMAILQHFDDCKITRRMQEGRVLIKRPDKT